MGGALDSPAELQSLRQFSVRRFGHKGQRGPPDWGPAVPEPWHCIFHRVQSKTPGGHLQLEDKKRELKTYKDRNPSPMNSNHNRTPKSFLLNLANSREQKTKKTTE